MLYSNSSLNLINLVCLPHYRYHVQTSSHTFRGQAATRFPQLSLLPFSTSLATPRATNDSCERSAPPFPQSIPYLIAMTSLAAATFGPASMKPCASHPQHQVPSGERLPGPALLSTASLSHLAVRLAWGYMRSITTSVISQILTPSDQSVSLVQRPPRKVGMRTRRRIHRSLRFLPRSLSLSSLRLPRALTVAFLLLSPLPKPRLLATLEALMSTQVMGSLPFSSVLELVPRDVSRIWR